MREIKFRGKAIDSGKWVYGYYVRGCTDAYGFTFDVGIKPPMCFPVEVNPSTVGQYTGLKDCKGDEIWEGDILKSKPYLFDGTYILGKVFWDSVRAMWRVEEISYKFQFNPDTEYLNEVLKPPHDTEIIGNVFDNPELLNN